MHLELIIFEKCNGVALVAATTLHLQAQASVSEWRNLLSLKEFSEDLHERRPRDHLAAAGGSGRTLHSGLVRPGGGESVCFKVLVGVGVKMLGGYEVSRK